MLALGFIETMGLIGAIEAADAMLKAADVRLLEKNLSSGGLVTISVCGEVAAVKASVDAAVAAIARIPGARLHSQHVIARPDAGLCGILRTEPWAEEPENVVLPLIEVEEVVEVLEVTIQAAPPQPNAGEKPEYSASRLKKMDVMQLRKLVQEMGGCSLKAEQIAAATKKDLIEAILRAGR